MQNTIVILSGKNQNLMNVNRVILKSREVKNLDYVAQTIVTRAKEKNFKTKGPRYMPNKTLKLFPRAAPNGNGKTS